MGQSESSMEDSDWFIQIRTAAHVLLCDSAAVRNDGAAVRNGKRVTRVVDQLLYCDFVPNSIKCIKKSESNLFDLI